MEKSNRSMVVSILAIVFIGVVSIVSAAHMCAVALRFGEDDMYE